MQDVEEVVEVDGAVVKRTKKAGTREGKEVVEFLRHRGARIIPGAAGGQDTRWLEMLEETDAPIGETKKER